MADSNSTNSGHNGRLGKPYDRSRSLFNRVKNSVKDILSPSWMVDLVTHVSRKGAEVHSEQTDQSTAVYGRASTSKSPQFELNSPDSITPPRPPAPQSPFPTLMNNTGPYAAIPGTMPVSLPQNPEFSSSPKSPTFGMLQKQNTLKMPAPEMMFTPDSSSPEYSINLSRVQAMQQMRQESGGSISPPKKHLEDRHQSSLVAGQTLSGPNDVSFLWSDKGKKSESRSPSQHQPPAKRQKNMFNASLLTNSIAEPSLSRNSTFSAANRSLNDSDFYLGRTVYGGASATKKTKVLSYNQSSPTVTKVEPKRQDSEQTGVSSSTAKRILGVLDRLPSPLSDAKKIPSYQSGVFDSPLSFSPGTFRRQTSTQSKGPPTANMTAMIPARPLGRSTGLLQYRGENSVEPTEPSGSSGFGKMKREKSYQARRKPEVDQVLPPPNLPTTFVLPVTGMPKFDFNPSTGPITSTPLQDFGKAPALLPDTVPRLTNGPLRRKSRQDSSLVGADEFKFSSPVKTYSPGDRSSTVSPLKFTFSSPIMVTTKSRDTAVCLTKSQSISGNSQPTVTSAVLTTVNTGFPDFAKSSRTHLSPNEQARVVPVDSKQFGDKQTLGSNIKEASVKGVLKPVQGGQTVTAKGGLTMTAKSNELDSVLNEDNENSLLNPFGKRGSLRQGSVLEALGGSTGSSKQGSVSESLGTKVETKISQAQKPLSALFGKPQSGWTCPVCMVSNKSECTICPCCSTKCPIAKTAPVPTSNGPTLCFTCQTTAVGAAGCPKCDAKGENSKVNLKNATVPGSWECPTCMVRNKPDIAVCPCCQTAKPQAAVSSAPKQDAAVKPLSSLFPQATDTWECSTCMIKNNNRVTKCVACETAKPGQPISNVTPSPTTAKVQPLSQLFKRGDDFWRCDTCLVDNNHTSVKCAACETPKPGEQLHSSFKSSGGFQFTFGAPVVCFGAPVVCTTTSTAGSISNNLVSNNVTFGTVTTSSVAAGYSFGASAPGAGFQFGSEAGKSSANNLSGGFKFGTDGAKLDQASSGFKFSTDGSKSDQASSGSDGTKSDQASSGFKFSTDGTKSDQASSGFKFDTDRSKSDLTSSGFKFTAEQSAFRFGLDAVKPTVDATSVVTNVSNISSGGLPATSIQPPSAASGFTFTKPAGEEVKTAINSEETSLTSSQSNASKFTFGALNSTSSVPQPVSGASNAFSFSTTPSKPTLNGPISLFSSNKPKDTAELKVNAASSSSTSTPLFSFSGSAPSSTVANDSSKAGAPLFQFTPAIPSEPGVNFNLPKSDTGNTASGLFAFGSSKTPNSASSTSGFSAGSTNPFGPSPTSTNSLPKQPFSFQSPAGGGGNGSSSQTSGSASLFTFGQQTGTSSDKPLGSSGGFNFGASQSAFTFGGRPSGGEPGISRKRASEDVNRTDGKRNKEGAFHNPSMVPLAMAVFGGSQGGMFGASSIGTNSAQSSSTPTFGVPSTGPTGLSSSSFNFSGQTSSNVFQFGSPQAPAPPATYGATPAAQPSGGFNFSATPNINFTAGAAPLQFTGGSPAANPFNASGGAAAKGRTVKKAVRKLVKK